jgi:hypothetical protein
MQKGLNGSFTVDEIHKIVTMSRKIGDEVRAKL